MKKPAHTLCLICNKEAATAPVLETHDAWRKKPTWNHVHPACLNRATGAAA